MNPTLEKALANLKAPHDDWYMGYDLPERVDAYSEVKANYGLPFDLYPFQQDTVDYLAHRPASGYYLDMGTGKTATSTVSVLYKMLKGVDQCVVLMPPILITNWYRWLSQIKGVSVAAYKGAPKTRKEMKLTEDFVLMSYQIFKLDQEHLLDKFDGKHLAIIADEATALKNPATGNYKTFKSFSAGHEILLLTGSPLSKPEDGYAYIKFTAPNIYRNMRHFENIHIAERDFFGQVTKYNNLDLLADSLKINSVRLLKEDVLKDLPDVTYTPMYFELDKDHYKLYVKLAEEQLLRLQDGSKIDATQTTQLYHALQQIVANYGHFTGDDTKVSSAIEMLEETIEESGKLVVFTNYRMTNTYLTERLKKYNATFIWGGLSDKQQRASPDTFINDSSCKVIVLQVNSAGFGIDGLQTVANTVLFLELPVVPSWFHQAVARLHRVGQKNNVNVRIAVAERTCMPRLFDNLMNKDALINRVVRGVGDLRDAVFGG